MKLPDLTIVIDTREQRPYSFPRSLVATLPTGDYSILGLTDRVSIERKSKEDAYSSLSQGRKRFERELVRLSFMECPGVIVESSLCEFLNPPAFSGMNPKAAMNSLIGWSVKYRVPVWFAGDRTHGNALALRILEKFWRYYHERGGPDAPKAP